MSRDRWSFKLAPQLSGKAQQAYAALNSTDAANYDVLKAAILCRYNINEETYRQRFRAATKKDKEAYRALATCLHDLSDKWITDCKTVQAVKEKIVTEQLLNATKEENTVKEEKPDKEKLEVTLTGKNFIKCFVISVGTRNMGCGPVLNVHSFVEPCITESTSACSGQVEGVSVDNILL